MSSLVVEQILLQTSIGGGQVQEQERGREQEGEALTLEDLELAYANNHFDDEEDKEAKGLEDSLVVSVLEDLSPKSVVVLLPSPSANGSDEGVLHDPLSCQLCFYSRPRRNKHVGPETGSGEEAREKRSGSGGEEVVEVVG